MYCRSVSEKKKEEKTKKKQEVAYLETNGHFPISQRHQHMGHVRVTSWRHKTTTQLITSGCIKS
jgi:hypothetical protein